MNKPADTPDCAGRRRCLIAFFGIAAILVAGRVFYLQILNKDFLKSHGDARSIRTISIPAHRGVITDRNNETLAVSAPVASIWAEPKAALEGADDDLIKLANILGMPAKDLNRHLSARQDREFVYLKRHVQPDTAQRIRDLKIPGVHTLKEYKRYYPTGEVTAHLVGFNNVDDKGQEGIELAYDHWLKGSPGEKRMLKDRYGYFVKDIENIRQPSPGRSLSLSMDQRLQYLAYKELKSAVINHKAKGGMLLLLDTGSGEVLSLAVQPSFNPNNRAGLKSDRYRNRVVTDVFEPGSTIKPFTVAAALISGLYEPESIIDTQPGYLKVGSYTIRDINNYGSLSVREVIKKSSNVGATKIATSLGPERLWELHDKVGFGNRTTSGYPGEVTGSLDYHAAWSPLELVTISYGYGMSVTTLQLGQAYAILAAGGLLYPITFQKTVNAKPARRVMPESVALEVGEMMRAVVGPGGSGKAAAVDGYHVAGKTGTVHKASSSGYARNRYLSLFAGFAPATAPRLALVVVINEPQAGQYFGGLVAAPVFSKVMEGALRILNIPPDNLTGIKQRTMSASVSHQVAENATVEM